MPFIINSNKLVAGLSVKSYKGVTNISSSQVYAVSRQQNYQLGNSLGSILLLFSRKVLRDHAQTSQKKSMAPTLSDSPVITLLTTVIV